MRGTKRSRARSSNMVRSAVRFVVRGHRRPLALMTVTAYVGGVAEALFLITVTRAAFAITEHKPRVGIVAGWSLSVHRTLLLGLGLVGFRMVLAVAANWQSATIATSAVAHMRHRLAEAFLHTSWPVQQDEKSGSLQELVTGYSAQAAAVMGGVAGVLVGGANLLALIGMAVGVEPLGALILVVSVVALALLMRPLRLTTRRRAFLSTAANLELATMVNGVADLGLELHVFHVQRRALAKVSEMIENARRRNRAVQMSLGLAGPMYAGLAYLALLSALAVVAESRAASLTSLGASLLVMLRSLSYGQALQSAYLGLSASSPAMDELQRRLNLYQASRPVDGGEPVDEVGRISVEHVSFAYVEGQGVLHDVSFCIEPHEIIGIVGPSGGGKSTLVQLLLGLRRPAAGRILADGRDIAVFDRAEWARKITFVPQIPHLIAGSVADNIRFLREDVHQDDIERAARLAHIHDDIERFPEGYLREVGEHGGHLSGGQQQRLCIARALVEHPDVLILDEPTSALDVPSEHLIRTTLLGLKEQMSVIIIAHRLSTLSMCDRIMVIQDGQMKGFDTPVILEQTSPFYREALALSGMH